MKTPSRKGKRSGEKKPAGKRSSAHQSNNQTTHHPLRFPIVGIGASAGGLEAFTELLKNLPLDTGMGFVLVQHLDPLHESALTQLLTRVTRMPVLEVTNNLRVEANHVYVIPPNRNLSIAQGVLKLQARRQTRPPTRSIDSFFESLAQDQRECAIGVILSGTASDGTLGLEAIKGEGGITFAQDQSAKYDSMPRSAVAAGCVDFVLSPEKIANELARIAKHPYVAGSAPAASTGGGRSAVKSPASGDVASCPGEEDRGADEVAGSHGQNGFKKILLLLRNRSGVDFSLYKPTTLQRRIARRMVLNKQNTLEDYAQFLRGNAKELDMLYSDMLISVTSFFRNPEAFDVLKRKVFPKLLQRHRDEPFRVWVLGCSTGQEAYSIAMAFMESAELAPRARKLQVFATDLNEAMLEKARHGLYAKTLAQDVSPERLRRFFVEEEGGYRVNKSLRERVVFARQNLISDPPFAHMDLISCRNLLIYLEPSLQHKAMSTFHYALKSEGFLFLGGSESIGSFTDLFEPVEKKHKIYSRKAAPTPVFHLPVRERDEGRVAPRPPGSNVSGGGAHGVTRPTLEAPEGFRGEQNARREADRVTVNQFAPPGVLINDGLQILQFRGATSAYLEPPTGKPSFDLLKMAREGLTLPLRAVINKAKKENKTARRENVRVQENGKTRTMNVEVIPLKNLQERCFLILFEEASGRGASKRESVDRKESKLPTLPNAQTLPRSDAKQPPRIAELERELSETRDYLQSIQEEHEAANEELQASNEEVQSANEELQSINEELETSKEELESTNEELITVNEEMANRNIELNRLNADLKNLQTSTKLPIVLLGRDLTIRRFSASAEKIFDLTAADVGRTFGDIRHNLVVQTGNAITSVRQPVDTSPRRRGDTRPLPLEDIVREVIDTVRDQEQDVRDKEGRWYSLRVRPYMTLDNKLDGAVLVLMDITDRLRLETEVRRSERRYRRLFEAAKDGILILDPETRQITDANPSIVEFLGCPTEQLLGKELWEIGLLQERANREIFRQLKAEGFSQENLLLETKTGQRREVEFVSSLYREDGREVIQCSLRDISERRQAEQELAEKARLLDLSNDAIIARGLDNTISLWNKGAEKLYGWTCEEVLGKDLHCLLQAEFPEPMEEIVAQLHREGRYEGEVVQIARDGRRIPSLCRWVLDRDTNSILTSYTDITERKQAEEVLRQAQAQLADRADQLEGMVAARTAELTETNKQLEAFVYSIAHDLRAPLRAMQGCSAMLVQEVGAALGEMGQDLVKRIDKSAQFMDALLKDLLAFSRISQERVELMPVNMEKVVENVLSHLQSEIQERDARVENAGLWPTVLAHEPTLRQLLFNLVSNALTFTVPNAPPLLRLRAEERGEFIRVWVEDNGIGIAPEHQDQIFRVFTRLHGERYPGTGIGLAIVQKGVERMGGSMGVDSTLGEGSRFWFELRKG